MAVSNLELENAIIQVSQQLCYARIHPDQNRAIKSFMEGRDVLLACQQGLEGPYASLCYPTRSITSVYKCIGIIMVVVSPLIALTKDQVSIGLFHVMRRRSM